jgi:uncharacterized membrane protein (DUF485 family)
MNWIFRGVIVGAAYLFPGFRFGYGVGLIILMQFVAAFSLFAAWVDQGSQPDWVVRNEIIFAVVSSLVGWVLGLALIRQAKRHAKMLAENLEEYERKNP